MEHTKIYYLHRGDKIPFYIGKTKNINTRLSNHQQIYGKDIYLEIISEVKNWRRWEKYYIKKYKDLGYMLQNKNEGGGGVSIVNEQTIHKIKFHPTRGKKISISRKGKPGYPKGRPFSEEHKAKIKAKRNHLKGRPNTWNIRPVVQYDINGKFLKEFVSQQEATIFIGAKGDGIGMCCRGKQKTAYGYIWKFK
jgi:hypothetical protein